MEKKEYIDRYEFKLGENEYFEMESQEFNISKVEIEWHRGMIPCPSGIVDVSVYALGKKLKLRNNKSTDIAWDVFDNLWNDSNKRFWSAYTEFPYPGSFGNGFSIHMPYLHLDEWNDFKLNYSDYYDNKTLHTAYRKFERIVDAYNEVLAKAEEAILEFTGEMERLAQK